MRCRTVLLKSLGLTSKAIGEQTKMTHISVYSWVKRFESEAMYARKDMCHTAGNPEEKMSLSLPKNSSGKHSI